MSQTSDAVADLLAMDLGGGSSASLAAPGAGGSSAAADLLDLLGGADLSAPPAPTSSGSNVLDLLGGPSAPAAAQVGHDGNASPCGVMQRMHAEYQENAYDVQQSILLLIDRGSQAD